MSTILDQFGKPLQVRKGELQEPQTARIATLENRYLTPMLGGLTPQRLAAILQGADSGNLVDQHRLFADMEERDAHLQSEMGKRISAIVGLDWDIVPPRDASAAEKKAASWVKEALLDATDAMEKLLTAAMDAVGHGFAPIELEWRQEEGYWLPSFEPRPQEWFQMNQRRDTINLIDGSVDGVALRPFGWIFHQVKKPKTGYCGRMGLYRSLAWPFLYKAYGLGDFAEFLETYGLPIILGRYNDGATADEKNSLHRAVVSLGHDARAVMPKGMEIEIVQATTGGSGQSAHLALMEWADKAESKLILGQTLTADAGSKGGGSYALGLVHNEVRNDICKSDARDLAASLTRDLVYPMAALNCPGIDSLRRCPRFVLNVESPEDMASFAENLPKLAEAGVQIPVGWVHERLRIPMPKEGEAVLQVASRAQAPAQKNEAGLAALSANAEQDSVDPLQSETDQLVAAGAPHWSAMIDQVKAAVDKAESLSALQRDLVNLYGGQAQEQLVEVMAAAFALAKLKGMADVAGE